MNRKVMLVGLVVLLSLLVIFIKGLKLGTDFTGGAVLIFRFDRPLSADEMKMAVIILEKRLNWTGLRDVTVRPWGDQHVLVKIGGTGPEETAFIKNAVMRQGKFEAVVDGNVALLGDEIVLTGNYFIGHLAGGYTWEVPFLLKDSGVQRFFSVLRQKCTYTSCPDIYFFIDRPVGKYLVMDENLYESEKLVPRTGTKPSKDYVDLNEVIKNAGVKLVIFKDGLELNGPAIVPDYLADKIKAPEIRAVPVREGRSWVWDALNLRAIIGIRDTLRARILAGHTTNELAITGWSPTRKEAEKEVEELKIILSSGSLPAAITPVSEQSIPPTYGRSLFLMFMAAIVVAAVVVAMIIALRYKRWEIVLPIIGTILSETIIVLGIAALIGWRLDIPSLVGLIASIGSGVDDQIIITDEMLRGRKEKKEVSLLTKIKRAFFVVFASAASLAAALVPLALTGIPTFVGFAFTTLMGIAVGVLLTRPAYADVLKEILSRQKSI